MIIWCSSFCQDRSTFILRRKENLNRQFRWNKILEAIYPFAANIIALPLPSLFFRSPINWENAQLERNLSRCHVTVNILKNSSFHRNGPSIIYSPEKKGRRRRVWRRVIDLSGFLAETCKICNGSIYGCMEGKIKATYCERKQQQ